MSNPPPGSFAYLSALTVLSTELHSNAFFFFKIIISHLSDTPLFSFHSSLIDPVKIVRRRCCAVAEPMPPSTVLEILKQ